MRPPFVLQLIVFLVSTGIGGGVLAQSENEPRALYTYSFGGLETMEVDDTVRLLLELGYAGIAAEARGEEALNRLRAYYAWSERKGDAFDVVAAFMAHRFGEHGFTDAAHRAAIDALAGKGGTLWVWVRDDLQDGSVTEETVEQFIRGIFEYAVSKGVKVVLYPHHNTYYPTVDDALPLVDEIDHPSFGIAVNLTHELRSDKGDVLEQTFERAKHRIAAVIISGSQIELDRTSVATMNTSTVLSLDESEYDLRPFVRLIKQSGFEGPVGFINFKLREAPADYLARTMERWEELCREVGLYEADSKEEQELPVYDAPDQAVWDPSTRSWFVSNLGGGISLERDGYGWIVRLDETGEVLDPRWVENLDAPSGMVVVGDLLYVVDRDGLYAIDIPTATIDHFYEVSDPQFLNDVALGPNGNLYVSDFSAQRIYRIDPEGKQVEVFIESEELDTPDGLHVDGTELIVASWGPIVDPATFATSRKGSVLSIDLNTKTISPYLDAGLEVGNLEGIAKAGDALFITDWMAGRLLRVTRTGFSVVMSGLQNPTDPNYAEETGILAIPEHGTNRVLFLKIPVH